MYIYIHKHMFPYKWQEYIELVARSNGKYTCSLPPALCHSRRNYVNTYTHVYISTMLYANIYWEVCWTYPSIIKFSVNHSHFHILGDCLHGLKIETFRPKKEISGGSKRGKLNITLNKPQELLDEVLAQMVELKCSDW